MYYHGARWYDPSIGRFISPDPKKGHLSNPQTLNLYVYAIDQPTGITDPSGMDGCGIFAVVCDYVSSGATTLYNGATTLYTGTVNAWNGLTPEERQGIILAGMIALTVATGGAAAPLLIGAGLAVGAGAVGVYAGYSYATGQKMTLAGALTAFTVGFGVGIAGAGLFSLASEAGVFGSAAEATEEGGGELVSTADFWNTAESSSSWSKATFDNPLDSLGWHIGKHAQGLSAQEYTEDAVNFRDAFWEQGKPWPLRSGGIGWKIESDLGAGQGGIYTMSRDIVTFWYGLPGP